jgi:hypothetical protein
VEVHQKWRIKRGGGQREEEGQERWIAAEGGRGGRGGGRQKWRAGRGRGLALWRAAKGKGPAWTGGGRNGGLTGTMGCTGLVSTVEPVGVEGRHCWWADKERRLAKVG